MPGRAQADHRLAEGDELRLRGDVLASSIDVDGQPVTIIHYDLYRMGSPEEFLDAGFRDAGQIRWLAVPRTPAPTTDTASTFVGEFAR